MEVSLKWSLGAGAELQQARATVVESGHSEASFSGEMMGGSLPKEGSWMIGTDDFYVAAKIKFQIQVNHSFA